MPNVKRPSVGAYFIALIFPPGYFFSRKRTGAGIVSLIVFLASLPLMMVFGVGLFLWAADAIWAMWNLRYELMNVQVNEQARAIAREMAAQTKDE
ncbi:MAG: hypothetical protein ACYDFU_01820 [Nitrospirota bacterium]